MILRTAIEVQAGHVRRGRRRAPPPRASNGEDVHIVLGSLIVPIIALAGVAVAAMVAGA